MSNRPRIQIPGNGVPLIGAQQAPSPQDIYNNIFMAMMNGIAMNAEAWRIATDAREDELHVIGSMNAEGNDVSAALNKVASRDQRLVMMAQDLAITVAAKVGIEVKRD